MSDSAVEIGIAIVLRGDSVLIGIRSADGPLPNKHEFPGGKCLPGESPAVCAVRECREETGLDVKPVRCFMTKTHAYAHATVRLHFWKCEIDAAEPEEPNQPFTWIPRTELRSLNWPAANAEIVDQLTAR